MSKWLYKMILKIDKDTASYSLMELRPFWFWNILVLVIGFGMMGAELYIGDYNFSFTA